MINLDNVVASKKYQTFTFFQIYIFSSKFLFSDLELEFKVTLDYDLGII